MLEGFWEVSSYRSNKKVYHFRCYQSKPLKAFLKTFHVHVPSIYCMCAQASGAVTNMTLRKYEKPFEYTHACPKKNSSDKDENKKETECIQIQIKGVVFNSGIRRQRTTRNVKRTRGSTAPFYRIDSAGSLSVSMDDSENDRKCQIHAGSLQHRFIGFVSVLFPYTAQIPNEIRFDIHR